MNNRAYLVFAINKETDQICGAGIFSEESPTTMGNIHTFWVLAQDGENYADAKNNLLETLKMSHFAWENKIYTKYGPINA